MRENRLRNALGIGGVDRQASYVEAKPASAAAHVEFVVSNKSTGRIGDELSPKLLPMCSATFLNCQRLPRISRELLGAPWGTVFLIRARRRKEEFGQANFEADVLPEPAGRLEIVKHVTGYGKS